MKKLLTILITATLLTFGNAWAIDISQAKSQGLVGETPSGYLEAVSAPDSATKKLIDDVNAGRKAQYQKIASENGTSIDAVEKLAGKKAIDLTEPGNYVKINGKWIKK
jgi:hypothetical protein